MMRKSEYFTGNVEQFPKCNIINAPCTLYVQERDWTCSIACLRSILRGTTQNVPSEEYFINTFKMSPGPHYSKDIKDLEMLKDFNLQTVIFGCECQKITPNTLLHLLADGCYVMVESMINYSHWLVLLGYTYNEDNEGCQVISYDPYYNRVRVDIAEEFFEMWHDGDYQTSGVHHDFIAIRS